MALIILASSLIMTLSYATEWFSGWYGGQAAERGEVAFAFTGSYAPLFWLQLFCNCAAPQILWWPRMRRSISALIAVSVGDPHRHVARAHSDHLEYAFAWLSAQHAPRLHADA